MSAGVDPMSSPVVATPDPAPTRVYRSGTPEPWERPALRELGELLVDARIRAGVAWPALEAVAGSRSSLREVETGRSRTRASRLRPWLELLGVDPDPVLERFAAVLAPEAADGRPRFRPVAPPPPKPPDPPPLESHEQALVGAELWRLRERAGLTRGELGEAIDATRMALWLVEHGQRRPTRELLEAWLRATGATAADRELLALRIPALAIAPRPRSRQRLGRRIEPDRSARNDAPTRSRRAPGAPGPESTRTHDHATPATTAQETSTP